MLSLEGSTAQNAISEPRQPIQGEPHHTTSDSPQPEARTLRAGSDLWVFLGFAAYAALFIYKSSFVIDHVRYFCLFDDDMISMRFAANLAHNGELVWNPGGEPVLGFTNLLWVLYMSVFHLLPIPASKISLCIQVSGALFLAASLLFVSAIARTLFPTMRTVGVVAMCLTAFYGPLVNWSLQGTEVSILALFVTASIWLALRAMKSESIPFGLYLLLAASTLCRIDMSAFALVVLLSLAIVKRHASARHLILGGSIVFLFLLGQVSFNRFYYGDLLPNTYYLKMTGYPLLLRLQHGLLEAVLFLLPLSPLVWLVLRRSPKAITRGAKEIIYASLAAQLLYSIWVGGDSWEWWGGANRFIAIVMPLFFILLAGAFVRIGSAASVMPEPDCSHLTAGVRFKLALLVVSALLLGNLYHLPHHLLLQAPLQTARPQPWDTNEDMVRQALLLRAQTDNDATIAVVWAGALPYFAKRRAVDLLGKNDRKIAMEPMHAKPFWPGHLKWDYPYSIGVLRPDVILQTWQMNDSDLQLLRDNYSAVGAGPYTWYVRRGSRHFRAQ